MSNVFYSYGDFQAYTRQKKNKTYILKPESGCQGRGIWITRNPKDIKPHEHMICQVYTGKVSWGLCSFIHLCLCALGLMDSSYQYLFLFTFCVRTHILPLILIFDFGSVQSTKLVVMKRSWTRQLLYYSGTFLLFLSLLMPCDFFVWFILMYDTCLLHFILCVLQMVCKSTRKRQMAIVCPVFL